MNELKKDPKLVAFNKLLNQPSAYEGETFKKILPYTPTGFDSHTEEGAPLSYLYKNGKDDTAGYRVMIDTASGGEVSNKMNSFFRTFEDEITKSISKATEAGNHGVNANLFDDANVSPVKFNYGTKIQIPFIQKAQEMAKGGKQVYVGQSDITKFWHSIDVDTFVKSLHTALFNQYTYNEQSHAMLKNYLKSHNLIQTFHDPLVDAPGVKSEHIPLTSGGQASRLIRTVWGVAQPKIKASADALGVYMWSWEDDNSMLSYSKKNLQQHFKNMGDILHETFGSKVNNHEVVDYTNPLNSGKTGKSGIHDYNMPLTQFKEITHLDDAYLEPTQEIHDRFSAGNKHAYDNLIAKNEILAEMGSSKAGGYAQSLRKIITDSGIDMAAPQTESIGTSNAIKVQDSFKFNKNYKNDAFKGKYTIYDTENKTKTTPPHNQLIEDRKTQIRNELNGKAKPIKGVLE